MLAEAVTKEYESKESTKERYIEEDKFGEKVEVVEEEGDREEEAEFS